MAFIKIKVLKDIKENGALVAREGQVMNAIDDYANRWITNKQAELVPEKKPVSFAELAKKEADAVIENKDKA